MYPTFHPLSPRPRLRDRLQRELNDLGLIGTIVMSLLVIAALVFIGTSLFPHYTVSTPVANTAAQSTQAPAQVNVTVNNGSNNTQANPAPVASPTTSTPPAVTAQNQAFLNTDVATYCPNQNYLGASYFTFITSDGRLLELTHAVDAPTPVENDQYMVEYLLNGEGASILQKAVPTENWTQDCILYQGGS